MNTKEIKSFMAQVAPVVREFVGQSVAPIMSRMDAMERRFSELPIPREPDESAVANVVFLKLKPEIDEKFGQFAAEFEVAKKDVDEFKQSLDAKLSEAISGIPIPSVKPDEILPLISEEVARAVSQFPIPKDGPPGKSIEVADVAPLISEEVAKAVSSIPVPRDGQDGIGLASALIDRDGNLVVTLTNGAQKELGPVVGRDGLNAEQASLPGQDVLIAPDDVADQVAKAVRALAERPLMTVAENEQYNSRHAPVSIHMPNVIVPEIVIPDIHVPEMKAPDVHVTVEQVQKRRTRTIVKEHDARGRILKFEQEEI